MWWDHDFSGVGGLVMTIGMAGFWIAVDEHQARLEALGRSGR